MRVTNDALWSALNDMADGMLYLAAPEDIDPATGRRNPRRWLPCSNGHDRECNATGATYKRTCRNVIAVHSMVVSTICEECAAPCADASCGLMVYEHTDDCEPRVEDEVRA